MVAWRKSRPVPTAPRDEWRGLRGRRSSIIVGENKVDRQLRWWHPWSALRIAEPCASHHVPAIEVQSLRAKIWTYYRRQVLGSALILLLTVAIIGLAAHVRDRSEDYLLCGVALLMLAFLVFDHKIVIRDVSTLAEHATFFLWIRECRVTEMAFWILFMCAAGAAQAFAQVLWSWDLEAIVVHTGVYFPSLAEGQMWRLLIGPFIHANPAHWFANLVALTMVGAFAFQLRKRDALGILVITSTMGALAGWAISLLSGAEGYVGISGGIFGLNGALLAQAWRHPSGYPPRFWLLWLGLTLVDLVGAALLSPDVSNTGHIAGFLAGCTFTPQPSAPRAAARQ